MMHNPFFILRCMDAMSSFSSSSNGWNARLFCLAINHPLVHIFYSDIAFFKNRFLSAFCQQVVAVEMSLNGQQ